MALELNEQGHVCGIRFLRTRLGEPDAQGRRRPVPVEGSEFVMPADAVIMAFGFNPHGMPWLESHGVTVDKWAASSRCGKPVPLPDHESENLRRW
ncbi:oxidoreductase [Escherichia coli]|uniref:Oxidoreductase n=1 Tax=Escherichia coli TaxID=562 RepID=A0A485JEQ3_ECOLX|nr:oxidoreductase [Escherichia coli]